MLLISIFLSGVSVVLRERADVRGAEITLGDVAEVSGTDAELCERVRNTSLGWAPAVGFSRWLEAPRIAAELERKLPGVEFDLRGAVGCRASPLVEHVRGEAIEAAARGELARWLEGRDAEVALAARIADIDVPSGGQACALQADAKALDLRATTLAVPVRVMVDGAVHRTVWTNWSVAVWESCSVPKRAIRAGETISADVLETRRVRARGIAPASADVLVGSIAAHDLPAGDPIGEIQLVRPNLIGRGDSAMLEVRRGLVSARVAVVADQAGKRGDRIRVVQAGGERAWLATVVERGLVVIEKENK